MSRYLFLIVAFSLLAIFSCFLIFSHSGKFRVESIDGIVEIESRKKENVTIEVQAPSGGDILLGSVYHLASSSAQEGACTAFLVHKENIPFAIPASGLALYEYDDEAMMWVQTKLASSSEKTNVYPIKKCGYYSLGASVELYVPFYQELMDELRVLAPQGTVGYEIVSGVSFNGGPMIMANSKLARGGCNGVFSVGNTKERSMRSMATHTLLNGLIEPAEVSYVAKWQVAINPSCSTTDLNDEKNP